MNYLHKILKRNNNNPKKGEEDGQNFIENLHLDRRTSLEDNVLHTNTIISYNEPFSHNVINVVIKATTIGQKIDLTAVSK